MERTRGVRRAALVGGLALALGLGSVLPGCTALRELVAVGGLDFSLDGVGDVSLAGVELESIERFEDVRSTDVLALGRAVSEGELPLALTLRVGASNPEDNPRARITALEWDLVLRDRETVSGALDREVAVEPGERVEVPLRAELDLLRFFESDLRELAEIALAAARDDVSGDDVRLRIHPRVETPLGAVPYPEPLVLSPGRTSSPEGG